MKHTRRITTTIPTELLTAMRDRQITASSCLKLGAEIYCGRSSGTEEINTLKKELNEKNKEIKRLRIEIKRLKNLKTNKNILKSRIWIEKGAWWLESHITGDIRENPPKKLIKILLARNKLYVEGSEEEFIKWVQSD